MCVQDMMPDWMLTLFMIPWMAAMELTGGLLGKMDANVFMNNEGFGFLMRGEHSTQLTID